MRIKVLCAFFLTIVMLLCSCSQKNDVSGAQNGKRGDALSEQVSSKKNVLMIYMVGSDLETKAGAGTDDLMEMENSGIDLSDSEVVVYAAGTPYWHNEVADGEFNNILRLTEKGFVSVEKFDSSSMCDSSTLTFFLNYVYENYSADEYSLIMWNHGSGPVMGYGMDIVYEKDALTLSEMISAMQDSPFGAENKLSWIGFDACLMASAELSFVWSDYAEYLVASQEIEPSFGWSYEFLAGFGKEDTPALLKSIIDSYDIYCRDYYEKKGYENTNATLSCVDLSYADELEDAVNGLFSSACVDMPDVYNSMVKKRVETRDYGKATTGSDYDLVDLMDMSKQLSELYPEETSLLNGVIEKMVVYSMAHSENSCGLSIYYPFYNKYFFENGWAETYKDLGLCDAYQLFLEAYELQWLEKEAPGMTVMKNVMPNKVGDELYTLELTPEQNETYAFAEYYILQQEGKAMYTKVYQSSDVTNNNGTLTANFDGNVIYVIVGSDGSYFVPVVEENGVIGDYTHYSTKLVLSEYFNFGAELNDSINEAFEGLEEEILSDTTYDTSEQEEQPSDEPEEQEEQEDDVTDTCHGTMYFTYNNRTKEFKVASFVADDEEDDKTVLSRGKAEEINLDEWHSFVFPGSFHRYLTRNDSGSIKPLSEWIDTGWWSHYEAAIEDGIHYEYAPLYDGNFSIIFEVTDTSGNKYCSELLPVKNTVSAESEEAEMQIEEEIDWSEGEEIQILDEHNVVLDMKLLRDVDYDYFTEEIEEEYLYYAFGVQNNSDKRIDVYIDDVLINDTVYATGASCNLYTKAGEYYLREYGLDFSTEIAVGAFDEMKSLSFTVELKDTVTGASIMTPKRYKVNISGEAKFDSSKTRHERISFNEPYLGAFAQSQTIYDSEIMTVKVWGFGTTDAWYNSSNGYISVENKTDSTVIYEYEATAFNDITCSGGDGRIKLPPGCIDYQPIDTYSLAESGIEQISKMDIGISVWGHDFIGGFGEIVWCPVVLSQKSDAVQPFTEFDNVIYDKNGIRISVSKKEVRSTTDAVYVSVVNNSDKTIVVRSNNGFYDGVSNYGLLLGEIVGPGQKRTYDEYVNDENAKEATFNLMIKDFSEEEVYYYEENPTTVKLY